MIPLPENAIPDVIYYIKIIFTDLAPLIFLIAGVYLAVMIIEIIISKITGKEIENSDYDNEE